MHAALPSFLFPLTPPFSLPPLPCRLAHPCPTHAPKLQPAAAAAAAAAQEPEAGVSAGGKLGKLTSGLPVRRGVAGAKRQAGEGDIPAGAAVPAKKSKIAPAPNPSPAQAAAAAGKSAKKVQKGSGAGSSEAAPAGSGDASSAPSMAGLVGAADVAGMGGAGSGGAAGGAADLSVSFCGRLRPPLAPPGPAS